MNTHCQAGPATSSDYGSDFDEDDAELSQLLDDLETQRLLTEAIDLDDDTPSSSYARARRTPTSSALESNALESPVEEDQWNNFGEGTTSFSAKLAVRDELQQATDETIVTREADSPDARSPLERFRTAPKKPLSVTDLVSPAWCELQYWYNLTKYGRIKRTPAMRQGSEVHRVLEEQVLGEPIPVQTETKEDRWGLKIWNTIHSLEILRETGLTRELEIWGVIHGQVVNGVIDELSFESSDPQLEAKIEGEDLAGGGNPDVLSNQTRLDDFFGSRGIPQGSPIQEAMRRKTESFGTQTKKVYLTDIKTRGSSTLPSTAAMRPTRMQLMTYRKLLIALASDLTDAEVLFQRYKLDPERPFSDSFIAQMSAIGESGEASNGTEDFVEIMLKNNSLNLLWRLLIDAFGETMPYGGDSVSTVLRAEYRTPGAGSVIGVRTFPYDHAQLEAYLADEMAWWKGEREVRGVEVEEAYKCRSCEFHDGCTWRQEKVDASVQRSRTRQHNST